MNKVVLGILTVTFGLVLLLGYWLLWPYRVSDIQSPAEVITKEVSVGDYLQYRLQGEMYNEFEIIGLKRRVIDGVIYTMAVTQPQIPEVGAVDVVIGTNKIPNVPPGEYRMEFVAIHRVNPIRTVKVYWETEPFVVVE